ncbi:hypothetical protein Tco_0324738 [Tanacetum coccineum]
MSNAQPTFSHPRSDVQNTHYEKLLPIMADKYEHERRKKEKLEEAKARLDFGDVRKRTTKMQESAYSESRTRSPRRHRRSHSPRQSSSVFTRLKRKRSRSPRHDQKNKARRDSNIFERLGRRGRRQEATLNLERKKILPTWKHQEGSHRQDFKKGGNFRTQRKQEKRPDRFTLLTKTQGEILALEKGKFKTPPSMTTPVEKRNANKFCEFHGEVGHNTDECNHLRKQIKDMLKARKLSHLIKELKQNSGKDLQKKKEEPHGKEKPQAILMIQPWQKAVRQKITQSFSPDLEISFLSLGDDEGAEGPLIIEVEIRGHQVYHMCIDGGSSFEILYEH